MLTRMILCAGMAIAVVSAPMAQPTEASEYGASLIVFNLGVETLQQGYILQLDAPVVAVTLTFLETVAGPELTPDVASPARPGSMWLAAGKDAERLGYSLGSPAAPLKLLLDGVDGVIREDNAGTANVLPMMFDRFQQLTREGIKRSAAARDWAGVVAESSPSTACENDNNVSEEMADDYWCVLNDDRRGAWRYIALAKGGGWGLFRLDDIDSSGLPVVPGFLVRDAASLRAITGGSMPDALTPKEQYSQKKLELIDLGAPGELLENRIGSTFGTLVLAPVHGGDFAVPSFPTSEIIILYGDRKGAPIVAPFKTRLEASPIFQCADEGTPGCAETRFSAVGQFLEAMLPGTIDYTVVSTPQWLYDRIRSNGAEARYCSYEGSDEKRKGLLTPVMSGPGSPEACLALDLDNSEPLQRLFASDCAAGMPKDCAPVELSLSSGQRSYCLARSVAGVEGSTRLDDNSVVPVAFSAPNGVATRYVLTDDKGAGRYMADRETTIDEWMAFLRTLSDIGSSSERCQSLLYDTVAAPWLVPSNPAQYCTSGDTAQPPDDESAQRIHAHAKDAFEYFYRAIEAAMPDENATNTAFSFDKFDEECLSGRETEAFIGACRIRRVAALRAVARYISLPKADAGGEYWNNDDNVAAPEFADTSAVCSSSGRVGHFKATPDAAMICTTLKTWWDSATAAGNDPIQGFGSWPITMVRPLDAETYAAWLSSLEGDTPRSCHSKAFSLPTSEDFSRLTQPRMDNFATLFDTAIRNVQDGREIAFSLGSGRPALGDIDRDAGGNNLPIYGTLLGVREWTRDKATGAGGGTVSYGRQGFAAHGWAQKGDCTLRLCSWRSVSRNVFTDRLSAEGDPATGFRLMFTPK